MGQCWVHYASNYEKNKGMQTWPRVGVCGDIVTRDAFKDVFSSTWNFQKNVTTPAGAADFDHLTRSPSWRGQASVSMLHCRSPHIIGVGLSFVFVAEAKRQVVSRKSASIKIS